MRISHIQMETAKAFDITPYFMRGPNRRRGVCDARNAAMWLSREVLGATLPEIAKAFLRDHSTVHSNLNRAEAMMERQQVYREKVMGLRRQLGGEKVAETTVGTEALIHEVLDDMLPVFLDCVATEVERRIKK
jgi:hypothetical protein